MNSVEDVFEKFKKTSVFADALGLKLSAASEMRRRKSIPVRYWPKLVEVAQERGFDEITNDTLVAIHAQPASEPERAA